MAQLVRIGDVVINLDQVTYMHVWPGEVQVYFPLAVEQAGDYSAAAEVEEVSFKGPEAVALRRWLAMTTPDLMALTGTEAAPATEVAVAEGAPSTGDAPASDAMADIPF